MAGWDWGNAGQGAATGAGAGAAFGPYGALIGGAAGGILGGLSGGGNKVDTSLWTKSFGSDTIQKILPYQLRDAGHGGLQTALLGTGLQGVLGLLQNPGGLPGNVSASLGPALGIESERIARDFANQRANVAGAAARTNAPASFAAALDAALGRAASQEQGVARRQFIGKSAELGRADIGQTFDVLNAILQYVNSARGTAGGPITAAAQMAQQNTAASQAGLSAALSALSKVKWGGSGGGAPIGGDTVYGVRSGSGTYLQ